MKKIVFIGVENSCRSQMAEAFGKLYGEGIVEVYSAGSKPSGIIDQKAIIAMSEVGYDLNSHSSLDLSRLPQDKYEFVITIGCEENLSLDANNQEDWVLPEAKHMDVRALSRVRDIIEVEVKELIERIGVGG